MTFNGKKFAREMMGRPARYSAYLSREHGEKKGERVWKEWSIEERDGWIVGATWVQTGIVRPGFGGNNPFSFHTPDDYEPPTFQETAPRRLVYILSPWPTARPVYVPPTNVFLLSAPDIHYFNPSAWDSSSRELASKDAEKYPRDNHGRWAKVTK